jgi:hypothetical protein
MGSPVKDKFGAAAERVSAAVGKGLVGLLVVMGKCAVLASQFIGKKAANLFKGEHMAMKRCPSGHYYDPSKSPNCPLCEPAPAPAPTAPEKAPAQAAVPPPPQGQRLEGVHETRYFMVNQQGIDPTVGWLVCIEGPERGKDYRIRSERNFIGRSPSMDLVVSDESISREKHAIIVFNPLKQSFKLQAGESRGLIYLNDEEVLDPVDLKAGDRIKIGQSLFLMVPFAGTYHSWTK